MLLVFHKDAKACPTIQTTKKTIKTIICVSCQAVKQSLDLIYKYQLTLNLLQKEVEI